MTLCHPMDCSMQALLSITNSWSLLKLMSFESVIPSNHLVLFHPLLLLPSIFLIIRVFSNESVVCMRWPKYWSFSIIPSNEYSGLISFRIDSFDLFVVQGTLKSLLQHHSSKTSILCRSAFSMVQLSHPHMAVGKTITLTLHTFVVKVMSLLFFFFCSEFCHTLKWKGLGFTCLPHPNPPSHLPPHPLPDFLPRSKHLLISWL